MKFKSNKIILFCNRRITPQIAKNWNDSEYLKSLLNTTLAQAENEALSEIDFKQLINYLLYSLGNYYRGNTIFVFQLLVAFLYLITPVDIVSDFLPGIGYLDDLLLFKMILDTYSNELVLFNKVKREMLDIKYMRVDPKVVEEFNVAPTEAVDLILRDKELVSVDGEQLINEMIAKASPKSISDYINFDVIEIIKYEVINYLAKSKSEEVRIDEELISSLIQLPNIVTKKDISYFLKNIGDIFGSDEIEIEREKKSLFSTNGYTLKFTSEKLFTLPPIKFVQVEADFTNENSLVLKYVSLDTIKIDYIHIVEIIDLARQKHIFDNTIIYFELKVEDEWIMFKIDKGLKQVTYMTATSITAVLDNQLSIIAQIIKERVM